MSVTQLLSETLISLCPLCPLRFVFSYFYVSPGGDEGKIRQPLSAHPD
jgi:hypothetical protein